MSANSAVLLAWKRRHNIRAPSQDVGQDFEPNSSTAKREARCHVKSPRRFARPSLQSALYMSWDWLKAILAERVEVRVYVAVASPRP